MRAIEWSGIDTIKYEIKHLFNSLAIFENKKKLSNLKIEQNIKYKLLVWSITRYRALNIFNGYKIKIGLA